MQCPECQGTCKTIASHVSYADGRHGYDVEFKCDRCTDGAVPDEMAAWIVAGQAMRDARVHGKPYRNLWEEARRRGISAVKLSDMERGKTKPVPYE